MTKTHTPNDFSSFDFSYAVTEAIKKAGYEKPTDVQSKTIPVILEGRDVLAGAETGSGKTAAFALPLLEKLIEQKREEGAYAAKGNQVRALILVPTRELAIQINDEIAAYAENITPKIRTLSVFGGVKINPQMKALRGGADVLVATPGRLLDLYSQNAIKFNKLQTLVLDEVDRLVGEGFKEEIEAVFKLLPNKRQNLMFTATYPDSIRYLIRRLLKQPVIINISARDDGLIDQRVFTVNYDNKSAALAYLLNEYDWKQILIFCSAKKSCDNLVYKLEKRGIAAVAMHGNKEQRARTKALREFKQGKTRVLIATDVAARGLDIEQLPCVINYELPRSPKDYIHRIGRTGRAGEFGFALSLIAHHEYAHFSVIEKHCNIQLARETIEGFEVSEVAPPPPTRIKPKKKASKKLSKKKKSRLQEQKSKVKSEDNLAPQKVWDDTPDEVEYKPKVAQPDKKTETSPAYKKASSHSPGGIRKGQVASLSDKPKYVESKPAYKRQESNSKPWDKEKSSSSPYSNKTKESSKSPEKGERTAISPYKKQDSKPWDKTKASESPRKREDDVKPTKRSQPVTSSPAPSPKKEAPKTTNVKQENASIWGEVIKRKQGE